MSRIISMFALLSVLASAVSAMQGNLYFEDRRRWGRWDAQISAVSMDIRVEGIFARTAMELRFKDVVSPSRASDSLELWHSFQLPAGSVVDSLYLWVGEQRMNGLIMRRYNAQQIYTRIVTVRRDPAYLVQNGYGGGYQLRIFPFRRHEERKVRICFATPLAANTLGLVLPLPVSGFAGSCKPLEKIDISVSADAARYEKISFISANREGEFHSEKEKALSARITARNTRFSDPASLVFHDSKYLSTGIALQADPKKNGEVIFAALLHPGLATGAVSGFQSAGAGHFYPAYLNVRPTGKGTIYDLSVSSQENAYALDLPIALFGTVRGSRSIRIGFDGTLDRRDYRFDRTFNLDDYRGDAVSLARFRAYEKAKFMTESSNDLSFRKNDITDHCLQSHILTPHTALLALEPGMIVALDPQERRANRASTPLVAPVNGSIAGRKIGIAVSMRKVTISLPRNDYTSQARVQIFNAGGKLVADLSDMFGRDKRSVVWDAKKAEKGVYIVRVWIDGIVMVKRFRLS